MIEAYQINAGRGFAYWEIYLDEHYSTMVEADDFGDWLATYRTSPFTINIYPLLETA